jgi:beta-N-acetylhexosaminidase
MAGETRRAAILGIAGTRLSADEIAQFRAAPPFGLILFARNIADPPQLRALTAEIRDLLGAATPILIDQEGGRVARLRPPHWPSFPPAAQFEHGPAEAAEANAFALGAMCRAEGLDVVCAPVLDLRLEGAHDIIGDRAFSADPAEVARLGGAWIRGLQRAGTIPVIKHIPGHGRAQADSHHELPRVAAARDALAADFAPFAALAGTGAWGMTAHILFDALDGELPVTLSPKVILEVIRGAIGFDGVLMSDDLGMKALKGDLGELAAGALAAGCDLALHCSGDAGENAAILAAAPPLTDRSLARLAQSAGPAAA